MEILLEDIHKSYEEGDERHVILQAVGARFSAGALTVILGKSGTGKSTLLNLIGGIDTPDKGAVLLDGISLDKMDDYRRTVFRRQKIGFIFQFFNLIPTLTVLENVTLIGELDRKPLKSMRTNALEILARVGLANRANAMPENLSGGEQQRVAIARALSNDPDIILADEPTGNLDEETGNGILALLRQLVDERGKTMVMATHSTEAAAMAEAVFQIRNKQLVSVRD